MNLRRYLGLIALAYTLVLVFLGFAAGRASAHDAYHDWLMPNGGRCCSDLERECRPVRSDWDADRGLFVILVDGRWRDVPPAAVIAKPSPDGSSHACIGNAGTIFCFVNGEPKG